MIRKNATAVLLAGITFVGITLSGCGKSIDPDATFATLGDTKITMGVANFMAKYQQSTYDQMYMSYFGKDMWSQDLYGDGKTLQDDVKSNVADQLQEMYLLKEHMKDYDISLSDDETAKIKAAADKFMKANTKTALKQIGATSEDYVVEALTLQTIQTKMKARIIQDADTTVTDEEAAQRTISYVKIDSKKSSTASTETASGTETASTTEGTEAVTQESTEEIKAAAQSKAEAIATASDFDTAVKDAGLTASTASYGTAKDKDATLDTKILEAADKLTSDGQVSPVVETDSAYYVIRLDKAHDADATATKKESLIKQKQDDYYKKILDKWKDKEKWTLNKSQWAKVTFEDLFTAPASTESAATESASGTESANSTENAVSTEQAISTEN